MSNEDQPLIRNCRFAFRCHQKWETLEQTDDAGVRYCHECSCDVLLCETDAQLRAALLADACVAVSSGDSPPSLSVGWVVSPPYGND